MRLGARAASRGFRLENHDSVVSTNDIALARGRTGDPGRLWIVAAEQTGGRGRLGRPWQSPRGNLFASLLLCDPAPADRAPELGFVAGVALAEAMDAVGAPAGAVELKWPNDALFKGAKISGSLLEATTTADGGLACVIGVGVNCVAHPEGMAYPATDMSAEGLDVSREKMFAALSDALSEQLETWAGGAGFWAVRAAWLKRAARLGQRLEVHANGASRSGVFETIDSRGGLVLRDGAEEFTVLAGDVVWPAK